MDFSLLVFFVVVVTSPFYMVEGQTDECGQPVPDYYYAHCEMKPNSDLSQRDGTAVRGTVDIKMTMTGFCSLSEIKISLTGFTRNNHIKAHGIHIHENADLSDGCASMGSHFNPDSQNHGAPNSSPFDRHFGDIGNIFVPAGSNSIDVLITDYLVSLSGNFTVIGRGLVLHALSDDLGLTGVADSLSTGNAGDRIACCVIGQTDSSHWDYHPAVPGTTE